MTIINFLENYHVKIERTVIAVLLLLAMVGIAFLVTKEKIAYAAVFAILPFAIVGFFLIQKRLYLAPLAILFIASYVPFGISTGTGSQLMASLIFTTVFVFGWFARMFIVERKLQLIPSPIYIPAFGFMTVTIVSLIWSQTFLNPIVFVPGRFIFVQIASALIMIISPAVLLLVGNTIHSEKYLKIMAFMILSVGFVSLINSNLNMHLPVNSFGLAGMWIMGLATAIALFDEKISYFKRIILILLLLAWTYTSFIVGLSWIAGWLPGFIACGVIVLFRSKILFILTMAILVIYLFLNESAILNNFSGESVTSGDTRLIAWEMNWQYTRQHWLFGMGPAGYAIYYMTFNPTNAMATHNNYIDIISETGVVGMAFYLAIFGVLVWRGFVVYRRVKGRRDFLEALSITALGGTLGCIIIMGFGDWLLPFAYTQTIAGFNYSVYNWLFLGTIISLDFMTDPRHNMMERKS